MQNLEPVENNQTQCQIKHHQSPTQSLIRSKNDLIYGFDYPLPDTALGGDLNMQWLNWMDVTSNGGSSINGDLG
jgi:hypothetical protein